MQSNSLVVRKYGGSSLATTDHIVRVANQLSEICRDGTSVVVVVSAMGDTTDELIEMVSSITEKPPGREYDALLSTGEIISSALLSMALQEKGINALSLTGAQAGIKTTAMFRDARIENIDTDRIIDRLPKGGCLIIAGFQGINEDQDTTTLGRGGSDTTAVALAAALSVERCEIFTDVAGVFTSDPRICPRARSLIDISYDEMLEMATTGAKVMHPRAVEVGQDYGVEIHVRSTNHPNEPGTIIRKEAQMEKEKKARAVTHESNVAKITIRGLIDQPGIAASLFEPLAEAGVSVDTIVQNASEEGTTDLTFTVAPDLLVSAESVVTRMKTELLARDVVTNSDLGTVSVVGSGMTNSPGYAAQMFRTLTNAGVNIDMISTSDIRITCVVDRSDVNRSVIALNEAFELGITDE
ncbi:MAG: aspartate kinase [Chloroflexota bacterium]|nr:aspartate kinase [Chloroflexota bacterium]